MTKSLFRTAAFFILPAAAAAQAGGGVSSHDILALADRERDAGMHQEALADYRSLRGDPAVDQARLAWRIAETLEKAGRTAEAAVEYANACAPGSPPEVAERARLKIALLQKGAARVRALREASDASSLHEVRSSALFHLAAALEAESPDEAVAAYDKLLAVEGAAPEYVRYARFRAAALLSAMPEPEKRRRALGVYNDIILDASAPAEMVEEACFHAAQLSLRDGKYEEASSLFARLARRFPGGRRAAEAALSHAWAAFMAGRDGKTLELVEPLCKGPADPPDGALYLQGAALRRLARNEEAARAFARLLRLHPGSPLARDARTGLIEAKFASGDAAGGAAVAAEAAGKEELLDARGWCAGFDCAMAVPDLPLAIKCARAASGAGTGEWARCGASDLGFALRKSGANVQAAAAYRAAAAKWKADSAYAAASLVCAGAAEEAAGRVDEALRDWTAAFEAAPRSKHAADALFRKGRAELLRDRFDRAETAFGELVSRFPESPLRAEALYMAGRAAEKNGAAAAAEKRMRSALEAGPAPALAARIHASLGYLLRKAGRAREAVAEFAAAADGSQEDCIGADALAWLAEESLAQGDTRTALTAARTANERARDGAIRQAALAVLGDVLEKNGDADGARRARLDALALPERTVYAARAALSLGAAAAAAGDSGEARLRFKEAASRVSSDEKELPVKARAWIGLARLERAAGNTRDALSWYMLVLTLPRDEALTAEARDGACAILESGGRAAEAARIRERFGGAAR